MGQHVNQPVQRPIKPGKLEHKHTNKAKKQCIYTLNQIKQEKQCERQQPNFHASTLDFQILAKLAWQHQGNTIF